MIWFFHRGQERLQYEIREAEGPAGYELVIRRPDGEERVERFPDSIHLLERSLELQRTLVADGWAAQSSRQRPEWHWVVGGSSKPAIPPDPDE
jgi:hypothetical protein